MKIRSGFVSNSSSSSFVVIGAKLKEEEIEKFKNRDVEDDDFYETIYNMGLHFVNESDNIVGKRIVESDEFSIGDAHYKISELNSMAIEVAGKLGIDIDRIHLFIGTESC